MNNSVFGYLMIASAIFTFSGIMLDLYLDDYNNDISKFSLILYLIGSICIGPAGIFLMGVVLLSKDDSSIKKQIEPNVTKLDLKKRTSNLTKNILLNIKVFVKGMKTKNYWSLGESIFVGFLLGWYYKVPNANLLFDLSESDSLWSKNLLLESIKQQSSFFSTELFTFNWIVFILSTLISFLLLLFFTDDVFRQYLYDKFTFKNERKIT